MTTRSVRLADVAKAAGVSQGTASNVFSRPELVREEVRARVHEEARRLGYAGPDVKGRLLRAGKVNAVGVAAVEPLSYFFEDLWARHLLSHISRICDAQGTGMALVSALSAERLDWNVQSAVVDGFILLCVEGDHSLVESTRRRGLPHVSLVIGAGDESLPSIAVDNFAGARMAAEHLVGLGHKRFAMLAMPLVDGETGPVSPDDLERSRYSATRERARGYWQGLAGAGIAPADVPAWQARENDFSAGDVHGAMAAWFAGPYRPTAILAMSDRIAMHAVDWLFRNGLSVPDDVSIVGFDGVPEAAVATPKLTTVEQPMAEIARLALDAALGSAEISGQIVLPARLAVRETTATSKR